ncbi:YIP1 family protein [Phaeobacter sp. 22II1-1F12B]|uniref:YIP1 family protein n=1 Tax=Phaeobacter sp. 22II1-1F12B TaxID=1317111 RepID=UPI000B5269A8|nr:YIP1 family protein [Phaeobacter sp. 22II1-1F12B]OWU70614.1 hypothetical protein ATO1_23790 [Phaeobacter sp. 22II1-1F12B]
MPVTADITATYRGPGRVVERLLAQGRQETRALTFVMLACVLIFVAQAPYQAREAHLNPDGPLAVRLYWSAFFWVFIMPLVLYAFALVVWLVSKLARRRLSAFDVRLTLFWALLAVTPVTLLLGLIAGFVGPGPGLQLVSVLWLGVFGWFWISGLIRADGMAA